MGLFEKISLFLLRISLGFLFLYAGYTKVINPQWSAEGYMKGAKTFPEFYQWLLSPDILPVVNFVNEWGLLLLGVSLILGVGVRVSSLLGAVLMMLYYFPVLDFPYPNPHSFIVDEHIVYICSLLVLAALNAGRIWGLGKWCAALPLCSRFPFLRILLG